MSISGPRISLLLANLSRFSLWRSDLLRSGLLIATLLGALLPAFKSAHADSYEIIDFGFGDNVADQLVGIESSGAVVFYSTVGPCGIVIPCWSTWVNGALASYTSTNPNPVYDNGTTSSVPTTSLSLSGSDLADSVFNNGYEVFGTNGAAPSPYEDSIFDGPDPVANFIGNGELDVADLNSSGDFVYLIDARGILPDEAHGEYYEAIDLTTTETPEPSSLLLLATGVLSVLGIYYGAVLDNTQ